MDESARIHDLNGWYEVKDNPLSRVGIYDYSGAQIGAPPEDAAKIFRVYRPAEELQHPDTIASFKLVPFINNHVMLGEGFTPAEDKGVDGVIGQDVYFQGDTLYGNPKVFSKTLAEEIKKGKTELSCGYRCRYEFTPGTWNGQKYDVVQRNIRGNHVALVDEGRMGPEVSILDQLTFTVDAKETTPVDEKLAEIMAAIQALTARLEAVEEKAAPKEEPPVEMTDDEKAAADEEAAKAAEAAAAADADTNTDEPATMDAALRELAALKGRIAALSARPAMDEAAIVGALAKKNALADKLSEHIGTFDHAGMTHQQVAEYGVAKLEMKGIAKGTEAIALDAYLQAKPVAKPITITTASDAAATSLGKRIGAYATGA